MDHPPHPEDVVEFPAGGSTTLAISCDKGYTEYFASSEGYDLSLIVTLSTTNPPLHSGDIRDASSNLACPGQPTTAIHANNIDDTAGCALGIAYKNDFADVQPEDFVIFSVIHTCPWYLNNDFQVPADMPACPNGGNCICAFFWIHNVRVCVAMLCCMKLTGCPYCSLTAEVNRVSFV